MTRNQAKALLRAEELDDVKAVAATASGRRLLARVFQQAHVFVALQPRDALAMAFDEGQRNIGLMVMNDILKVCPEKYLTISKAIQERKERYGAILVNPDLDEDVDDQLI